MENIEYKLDGSKLHLIVDISAAKIKAAMPSQTGATRLLATSRGFQMIDPARGIKMQLNVSVPKLTS
jgi:hypothetical protein